ncbi:MAG: HAMP domain-containing sensor histidine kinase [Miniphocaeibacter sp.]|uniref:sensor histidine kinase n=1 Tax=Miniphocaeibacter sp. TaxID=3100973 RepID=UPI0017FB0ABF|nr:HAMP domain-containing histidine kinase [Gallicola sp.]
MWISKKEILNLSKNIRRIIDGNMIDIRDNKEGPFGILKNDIYTLATLKNEEVNSFHNERDLMSETLANISHQLKTPLTSMMVMADLLENAPKDKQLEFISNIKIGLAQMEWLVSVLLKMAKLDAGAVEFSREKIKGRKLIGLSLEPLEILLDLKNQNVEILGDITLTCDRKWTAEALTNIIKNASEYSPAGKNIVIEFGENPIATWISVSDSGNGITNLEIANLFKRFEGTVSEKSYGIGLPLALAIIRGQNGDIDVDGGGKGKGATFTLKFFK